MFFIVNIGTGRGGWECIKAAFGHTIFLQNCTPECKAAVFNEALQLDASYQHQTSQELA